MIELLNVSASQLLAQAEALLKQALPTIITVVITLIAAYILVKTIMGAIKRFFSRAHVDSNVELLVYNFSGYILWFIVATIIVGELGLSQVFTSMLAVSALLGMAGALALKDTIANMLSGLTLLSDRDFNVGDKVKILKIAQAGTITDIKLTTTRLDTENGRLIVPNSIITDSGWKRITKKK